MSCPICKQKNFDGPEVYGEEGYAECPNCHYYEGFAYGTSWCVIRDRIPDSDKEEKHLMRVSKILWKCFRVPANPTFAEEAKKACE